ECIKFFVVRKRVMPRIVHDIKTDRGQVDPKQGAQYEADRPVRLYEDKETIQYHKRRQEDRCLQENPAVARPCLCGLFKVVVCFKFKGFGEQRIDVVKFGG